MLYMLYIYIYICIYIMYIMYGHFHRKVDIESKNENKFL